MYGVPKISFMQLSDSQISTISVQTASTHSYHIPSPIFRHLVQRILPNLPFLLSAKSPGYQGNDGRVRGAFHFNILRYVAPTFDLWTLRSPLLLRRRPYKSPLH